MYSLSVFRTEILPVYKVVEEFDGDLTRALDSQRYVYVAYITSFVVVGEPVVCCYR